MDTPFRNLRENLPTCQGSDHIIRWLARAVTVVLAGAVAAVMGQGAEETPLFSAQQAAEGKTLYAARCAACHGQTLQGGTAGPLAGPAFEAAWTLDGSLGAWADSQVTVDDLDFIIRNTMPRGPGGKMSAEEYTAVLTYVLQQNGYPAGSTPLRAGSPRMKHTRLRFGIAKELAAAPPPMRVAGNEAAIPKRGGPTQEELNRAADSTRDWLYHTHDYSGSRYVALDQVDVRTAGQLLPICVFQVGEEGNFQTGPIVYQGTIFITTTRDWLYHTHDYSGSRYVALDQVDARSAGQLRPICVFQVGDEGNFQTGPIVYQGTIYITTARGTVALDATNCRPKWRHTWVPHDVEVWRVNRGVAIKDGYLIRGTSDGYLLALNAATGALVWAVKAANTKLGETFTMAPLLFEDLVLIGPAGSEAAISGWVGAFRLRDGSPVWKFQTVPGATQAGSESWGNPKGIKLGGGSVWTPFSLDAERGELFVAVTNPAPDLPANLRPGDNRYTNSAVVLNVRTGKLLWYKQMVPNDSHDWDLTQVSPLFRANVGGLDSRLVATVGKNGILRPLDRDNHEVVYSTAVTTIKNVDIPVTKEGVVACPGALGGVEWNGPALHRELNLLYVNAVDWCNKFTSAETVRYIPGRFYFGGTAEVVGESQGWLTAIEASTGQVKWKYQSKRPMVAAVTATKGNVVFTGELTGDFLALDARDGKVLYRFNTGGAIGGGVVTYQEAGRQYVAVMSGRPSPFWVSEIAGAPTVFLFALP